MLNRVSIFFFQIFLFLFFITESFAAPKYIIQVSRNEYIKENPPAAGNNVNSTILLESEDGSFVHNIDVSGQGMSIDDLYDTTLTDNITVYIQGTSGSIPWRLTRTYSGEVSAGATTSGYVGMAMFPASNLSWQPTTGYNTSNTSTPLWIYAPTRYTASIGILPVDKTYQSTGTTNSVVTYFAAYPGIKYYYIATPTLKAQQRRRYYTNPPNSFSSSGSNPFAYVDVDIGFHVATSTLQNRKRNPGRASGPENTYTCPSPGTGQSGSSSPGGGASSGSDGLMSLIQNIGTGNVLFTLNDPVKTRGFPLRNRIHLNSQVVETTRPMGNGTFSYDIHVTTQSLVPSGGGSAVNHWILVDGDGQRMNFGLASGSPTPEAGVFSTLTQNGGGGFDLTNAGPPEEIKKAGNYSYEFDSSGNLLSITDPAGNEQTLTYSSGQLISVLDVNSNKNITYTYSGSRITQVTENGGGADTYLTYSSDKITKIELKESSTVIATVDFTYDGSNNLLTITRDSNAESKFTLSYQTQSSVEAGATVNLTSVSWPTGASHVAYNLDPKTHASRAAAENSNGGTTSYEFDSNWNLKELTIPQLNGATTEVTYTYTYDANNNMASSSDGSVTKTFDYETNGMLHKITEPGGYYKQFNHSAANLTSIEDSIGTIATITYGNMSLPNLPTEVEDALGNSWTYTYNAYGQVTQIDPPTGAPSGSSLYTYDESSSSSPTYGWLTQIEDGEGNLVDFDGYNSLGDVTSISTYVDPLNSGTKKTTAFSYDAAHRVKVITHPDSKTITNSYTGSQLTYTDDEASKRTNYTWCADCGAPASVSKPLSWSVSWQRNYDKQIKTFTDSRGYKTSYTYGEAKELVGISYPDSTTEEFEYDNYGRTSKYINGRAEDIETDYDSNGRISEISFPTTSDPSIEFTYRGDSLIDEMTDAVGTTSYDYYSNRLIQAIHYDYSASGLTNIQHIELTYNEDYSIDTVTWKDDTTTVASWSYTYDLSGRLTSVTSFSETTSYTFDGQNKILTQSNANGTETEFTYNDNRGWPTNITHSYSSTPFAEYDLTYDAGSNTVGNLTRVDESGSDYIVYAYDDLYRLTSETRTGAGSFANTFVYDLSGNLTTLNSTSFASYDSANKISSIPSGSITNDNNGNITAVNGAGMSATTLTWDGRDKLVSQNNSSITIDYGYDGDGKRAWSKVGSDPKTYFIFFGDTLIGEISGVSQLPTQAYTWGADGLVSQRDIQNTETYWYHFGPQGETRQLTDDTGSVVNTYAYDAYGKTLSTSGSTINPYRYAGKYGYYTDGSAGMMLAGARWYSPDLKRWVSRDPINYEGGYNLYAYVSNNPVNYHDNTGWIDVKNNTGINLPYKYDPSDNIIKICKPGETCDMDGFFHPDYPPHKIAKYCYGNVSVDEQCKVHGWCIPGNDYDVGPDFFGRHPDWPNPYTGNNGWPQNLPLYSQSGGGGGN